MVEASSPPGGEDGCWTAPIGSLGRTRLLRLRPPGSGCVASPRPTDARLPARFSSLFGQRRARFSSCPGSRKGKGLLRKSRKRPYCLHGSLGRTRTCNLVVNSHPLCRLSYQGTCVGRQENIIPTASYVKRNRRPQNRDVDEFGNSLGTEMQTPDCKTKMGPQNGDVHEKSHRTDLKDFSCTSPFCGPAVLLSA